MAYLVNKTDGTLLTKVFDGQTDSPYSPTGSSSITLIGRQVSNYGELQNENLIHILENFSNSTSPSYPIAGQLWWNKDTNVMSVFNGSNWYPVTGLSNSGSAPTNPRSGDQWWDTTNHQFFVYDGTAWVLVGPSFSSLDGKSGAIVETVYDVSSAKHTVIKLYQSNTIVAIISKDATFTPNVAITGFTTINPGITFTTSINAVKLYGTSTNADAVGNVGLSQLLRSDVDTVSTANVTVRNNFFVGTNSELRVTTSSGNVTFTNSSLNKNISFKSNVGGTLRQSLLIDGTNGLISVLGDPTTDYGVATKIYVDTGISNLSNATDLAINAAKISVNDNIASNVSVLNANIAGANAQIALRATIDSPTFTGTPQSVTTIDSDASNKIATTQFVSNAALGVNASLVSNVSTLTSKIDAANAEILLRATIYSPTFTGAPSAPTPTSGDSSGNIATTSFVTTAVATASADLGSTKANINSPIFTGTPKAPTPTSGDNSTKIATTQFVTSAISSFDATKIYNGSTNVTANQNDITMNVNGTGIVTVNGTGLFVSTASPNDNSTRVATTAYVDSATKNHVLNSVAYKPTYYISQSAPNNGTGNDGDIWFQY